MNTFFRKPSAGTLTVAALLILSTAAAGQTVVPVPKVMGPIPVTANSVPFLASGMNLVPLGGQYDPAKTGDLASAGYVEEEFIVSGSANVYDWAADGSLNVKTPNAPYTTRILVRRPANAAKFSGNVIFEPLENTRLFDWAFLWATSNEYFTEHGDAWV